MSFHDEHLESFNSPSMRTCSKCNITMPKAAMQWDPDTWVPICKVCVPSGSNYGKPLVEFFEETDSRLSPVKTQPIIFDKANGAIRDAVARDAILKESHRPSWVEICMSTAINLSKRSTCKTPDRQVGCVITTADHTGVAAWGYNGRAAGSDDPCDFDASITKGSRCTCAHAEMNAISKLRGNNSNDLIMYTTLQPCMLCAILIVNSRCISKVVYLAEYRDSRPIFTLRQAGIVVEQAQL